MQWQRSTHSTDYLEDSFDGPLLTDSTRHFGLPTQSENDLEPETLPEGTASAYEDADSPGRLLTYALLALSLEDHVWLASVERGGRVVGHVLPTLTRERFLK